MTREDETMEGGRLREQTAAPADRTYGVCVGGGMAGSDDEFRDPVLALQRAEALAAEGCECVQVILWTEPVDGLSEKRLDDARAAAEDARDRAATA